MTTIFPTSPSVSQEFFSGGKAYIWIGTTWGRIGSYRITDAGSAFTDISDEVNFADGGSA